jgi:NADH:ubiquinone reductase (H+-translocating)
MTGRRVVIVGGGFAGLHAAKRLGKSDFDVTLIDKRNFQLFQPLLYQVATGSLPPGDIAIPQRVVLRKFQNVRVLQATARDVDPQRKALVHEFGELTYDALIVATGVKHSYFGHDEWRAFAPGLKTIEHATEMRHRIFRAFERAEISTDPVERSRLMTFVIVGAGPTGVELAGALGELAHKIMIKDFRAISTRDAKVILIEGAKDVLPPYDAPLRAAARKSLETLGVTVLTETMVEEIGPDFVRTKRGQARETISCGTVLWAAGVTTSAFGQALSRRLGLQLERGGRIAVGDDFSVPGHPDLFVVGDLARMIDASGREVPGLAQGAIQGGHRVAETLIARAKGKSARPFRYRDYGTMAVIGMNHAVGDLKFMKVTGIPAWFIWAFVHVMSLVDAEQRIRVFVQWAFKYFTRREGDRLITQALPASARSEDEG